VGIEEPVGEQHPFIRTVEHRAALGHQLLGYAIRRAVVDKPPDGQALGRGALHRPGRDPGRVVPLPLAWSPVRVGTIGPGLGAEPELAFPNGFGRNGERLFRLGEQPGHDVGIARPDTAAAPRCPDLDVGKPNRIVLQGQPQFAPLIESQSDWLGGPGGEPDSKHPEPEPARDRRP
jgi:hypothetical protein